MITEICTTIANYMLNLGYVGIVALMFLESSFFPFPSEMVMIPAGYWVSVGKLNMVLVIVCGTMGSILGALFNYFIAYKFGIRVLTKWIISEQKLAKLESIFYKHGEIITFTGRLIPGLRQYISFPAGLGKMNVWKFILYTGLGASIWVSTLAFLGYYLGKNIALIKTYLHEITLILTALSLTIAGIYFWRTRR